MSTLSELSGQMPSDPDAQATITDFLDYTEFFPSDLFRSLTLIGKLDEAYEQDTSRLHDLTRTYGKLPSLPVQERPEPRQLRADISTTLEHASRCRESTYAEAARICTVAEHLYERLQGITRKLKALPKPPSRVPTPEPVARSPDAARKKPTDRKSQALFPEIRASARNVAGPKHRSRKIIVPGEVLPPFDPLSPGAMSEDESEMDRGSSPAPIADKRAREKTPKIPKVTVPKVPKVPKEPKSTAEKKTVVRIRAPGMMGTNVHSQVAGISVSNAMASLVPPPEDAQPGSKYRPWMTLTEWELNKLRKRMKKNADWIPSDTMVRRELAENGRGLENFMRAKAQAEETGEPLLNESPEEFVRPLVLKKAPSAAISAEANQELENRGMKLNQAKKLKREALQKEQAALEQAAIQSLKPGSSAPVAPMLAVVPQGDVSMADVTDQPGDIAMTEVLATTSETEGGNRKRKRESSPGKIPALAIDPSLLDPALLEEAETQPVSKKIKLSKGAAASKDIPIVLAPLEPSVDAAIKEETTGSATKSTAKSKGAKTAGRASRGKNEPLDGTPVPSSPSILAAIVPETAKETARSRGQARTISLTFTSASKQKAASAEPQPPSRRTSERQVRRASDASLPSTSGTPGKARHTSPLGEGNGAAAVDVPATKGGRKGKRTTPGLLTSHGDEGGAKVSLGKRKAAPNRKKSLTLKMDKTKDKKDGVSKGVDASTPVLESEDIDPNEERYCICNDVSWGTMIACESNDDCEKEWFHLPCVGLTEIPKRRQKWYCPLCRAKYNIDETGAPLPVPKKGKK